MSLSDSESDRRPCKRRERSADVPRRGSRDPLFPGDAFTLKPLKSVIEE